MGNVSEHTQSECLVDIDVASDYQKYSRNANELADDNYYYGINIAIINFSDKLLGEDILNNIIRSDAKEYNDRYKKVIHAYEYHKIEKVGYAKFDEVIKYRSKRY